jgi:aminotransferase
LPFLCFPLHPSFGHDIQRVLEEALEGRVAVIPGNAFGQCGEGFIRCSYVTSLEDIEEALERMGRFVRRHG